MIDVPTPGNLIKTISELVVAANAGGSGLSTVQAEANPSDIPCAQNIETTITDWVVDYHSGSDIILDGDGQTFHITPGYYHLRMSTNVTRDNGTTNVILNISSDNPVNSEIGPVKFIANGPGGQVIVDYYITSTSINTFILFVIPEGGSAPETLSYGSLDIVRMATVTP